MHGENIFLSFQPFLQLASSDIVIISCSLSEETRGMFDKKAFEQMKPESIIVNIARGGIVNQEDLVEALKVMIVLQN